LQGILKKRTVLRGKGIESPPKTTEGGFINVNLGRKGSAVTHGKEKGPNAGGKGLGTKEGRGVRKRAARALLR